MSLEPPITEQINRREWLLIEAAIKLFSRDGFEATSVRAVADEAGVSWGLVRFYFGSKEGLREAAERYVMSSYLRNVREAGQLTSSEQLGRLIETHIDGLAQLMPFLRWAIMEQRPVASEFIKEILLQTESAQKSLRERFPDEPGLWDPVRTVALRMGYLMIAPQVEELLGRDLFSTPEVKRRNLQDARVQLLAQKAVEAGLGDGIGWLE